MNQSGRAADTLSKKSQDRSHETRQASPAANAKSRDRKEDQADKAAAQPPAKPQFQPPRKNVPMLILSVVLLIGWLIVMLAIAVNK